MNLLVLGVLRDLAACVVSSNLAPLSLLVVLAIVPTATATVAATPRAVAPTPCAVAPAPLGGIQLTTDRSSSFMGDASSLSFFFCEDLNLRRPIRHGHLRGAVGAGLAIPVLVVVGSLGWFSLFLKEAAGFKFKEADMLNPASRRRTG